MLYDCVADRDRDWILVSYTYYMIHYIIVVVTNSTANLQAICLRLSGMNRLEGGNV